MPEPLAGAYAAEISATISDMDEEARGLLLQLAGAGPRGLYLADSLSLRILEGHGAVLAPFPHSPRQLTLYGRDVAAALRCG